MTQKITSDYLTTAIVYLCFKNQVLESFNANLFAFFLERDPTSLTDLTKVGGQYYAVHRTSKG